jgi:heme-degrading monooxygenase HmoA
LTSARPERNGSYRADRAETSTIRVFCRRCESNFYPDIGTKEYVCTDARSVLARRRGSGRNRTDAAARNAPSEQQPRKERAMSELVTHGVWRVSEGHDAEFVEAWTRFVQWASTKPGAKTFRLSRDTADRQLYVSFAPWASSDVVSAWKQDPEFPERMAQVRQHVESFQPSELSVVAVVDAAADLSAI